MFISLFFIFSNVDVMSIMLSNEHSWILIQNICTKKALIMNGKISVLLDIHKVSKLYHSTECYLTLETLAIFCSFKPWGAVDSTPPMNNAIWLFSGSFFYTIIEIYINEEAMQKIGFLAFIFRACLIWPSDSWQIWQNFGFVKKNSKSLSKLLET